MESIPEGLEFNSSTVHPSVFQAWLGLLQEAQSSIDIASFYWTLTNSDTGTHEPTAHQVSWSYCWWLRIRNTSEDQFSLERVVYFLLRVRPFWRGWLSSQGDCRFVLQWTHLRRLKTTTSGSSTTQVTLAADKMTLRCFLTPLKVFHLHGCFTFSASPSSDQSSWDMLLFIFGAFNFYCTFQLCCTCFLKSVSLSETHEKCSRSWYPDSQHERPHFRCPSHKVLDCR